MDTRRERLALAIILLLLTSGTIRCASQTKHPETAAENGAGAPSDEGARRAFKAKGVDAPPTVAAQRRNEAKLDPEQMEVSVGEAREVSEDELARLESRGERYRARDVAVRAQAESVDPSEDVAASEGGGGSDERGRRGRERPRPAPRDFATEPAPPTAAARAGEAAPKTALDGRSLEQDVEKKEKAKDPDKAFKNGDKESGQDAPATVLPQITRAPALGKVLVRGESGKLEAIRPRAVRVLAYVQGPRARTVVDYVFENPHAARLEGTFYHPLPADASPAGFAMFEGTRRVDGESMFQSAELLPQLGREMIDPLALEDTAPAKAAKSSRAIDWGARKDARVVEQKRAREVYEDIVRNEIDPALLEWSGGSNFQARVFPLEPQSLKRIVVAYEQPLVFDGARYRYGYVLPDDGAIKAREGVLFVDTRHGSIAGAPAGATEKKLGRWTRFDLTKPGPGAALDVAVAPSSKHSVLRGRDPAGLPGDTFYTEVRPELPRGELSSTGRALILVDTSLSSEEDGAHARRAKLIEALLAKDPSIEEYAVALFDLRVRWLRGMEWRKNTPENRSETLDDLRRVYLEGATSFAAVLEEMERQRAWLIDGGKTTAFLLSDGEITWGMDKVEGLAAKYPVLRDVRWITYRFGEAPVNRALFDLLSAETRGRTVTMLSEAEAGDAAVAHRAAAVVLEGVKVKGAKVVDLVVAGEPKLVFPGQTLSIAGRLPDGGAGAVLSVSIGSGGTVTAIDVPLGEPGAGDNFAPRAWADLHTKRLIGLDDVRLDRMVVALSQHYRLANARASFLILDREEQAAQYKLADETVDLANLDTLRRQEEDQRRDRLLGIALDEVPREGRDLVTMLRARTDGLAPLLQPQPLLEAPFAGGEARLEAEVEYRRERQREKRDFLVYDRIARRRALSGDTAGAVRALSSAVEVSPRDGEAMRLVGYALLGLAQYDVAAELFERLRLNRPFEPEAYLEEALALDAAGRYWEAARNYEIVLAKPWPRHQHESRITAAYHYARLLDAVKRSGAVRGEDAKAIGERMAALWSASGESPAGTIDLQLTTFWSTDSIDIDLWVYEPNGEKCFYSHRETTLGGKLFWDVTDGLGPELYHAVRATPGQYDTLVHFYGSRAARLSAPTAMLMVVDRGLFSPNGAAERRFQMRMLPKRDAVLMMRTDVFEAR